MLDWLKPILGDGYNEKSTTRSPPRSTRALSPRPTTTRPRTPSVQRQRLWPTPTRRWPSTRTPTSTTACAKRRGMAGQGGAGRKRMRTPALRRYSLMQSWIPLLLPRMGAAARPSVPCSIWTPCAAAKTPTRTFPPRWPRCRRDSGYMFDTEETPPPYAAGTGRTAMTTDNSDSALRKAMGLPME